MRPRLVRTTTQQAALNACVVFYSYTGVTRGVAERIRNACGCDLVEVKTLTEYSAFTAYTTGVLHSRRGVPDPILPERIDVSRYDLLVIGTPVWAWKPAPAINAAVRLSAARKGRGLLHELRPARRSPPLGRRSPGGGRGRGGDQPHEG